MHAVDTGRRLQFIEMGKGRGKGRTKRTKNLKTTVDHGTYIHDIVQYTTGHRRQKKYEIQSIHFFLCVCLPSLAATTTTTTTTCVHTHVCTCSIQMYLQ